MAEPPCEGGQGPMRATIAGQPDLSPATYRIGRLRVTEKDLDDYVAQGLLKSLLRSLCHALG